MTMIDVFVKKRIEIPDSVTIRGNVCRAEFYDDSDFVGEDDERYTYFMCFDNGTVPMEIRIYEQSMNDEVFIAAVVESDIVEDCYVPATSESVTEMVYAYARYLDSL